MEDPKIVAMLLRRDERAIAEFEKSHKRLCIAAAREITGDPSDAEECFNDTCLAVWNSIPPQNPTSLKAYALRICRNFALNIIKQKGRQKRSAILVELDECVSEEIEMEPQEIGQVIDRFMAALPKSEAIIFMKRYFCSEPVKDIAAELSMSENKVSKLLAKLRGQLKKRLDEGGINI